MARLNRREFLKGTVGTMAVAGATIAIGGTKASGKIIGSNDRFRIAILGMHGRGRAHLGGYVNQPNVEIAYLVDPDSKVLAGALGGLTKQVKGKYTPKGRPTSARCSRTRTSTRSASRRRTTGTR